MSSAVSVHSAARVSLTPLFAHVLVLANLLGCGADAPLATEAFQDEQSHGPARQADAEDGERPQFGPELEAALEREELAPGYVDAPYPEGPYGFVRGSVIPNLEFLGWAAPSAVDYDLNRIELLELGRFYDPEGEKGIEFLLVNASAVWCTVCQAEFLDLRELELYDQLRPRGVEMLGVLFEDRDALPARYADLQEWARVFEVAFPFVLDPGFKMGAFFDRSATPMNMVVDTRTMELVFSMTGYNPELYDWIDRQLEARGR